MNQYLLPVCSRYLSTASGSRSMSKEIQLYELAEQDYNVLEEKISANPGLITMKDTNDRFLLHWAALRGRELLVEELLKKAPDQLEATDDTNATPLILATLGGHLGTVRLLAAKGASVNHKNWQGHSSLQYACSKGHTEICKFLVEHGADINITDNRSDTPLHRVASQGRLELLRYLLEHSAKVDIQNAEGNTPLAIACEDEQNSCALLLVDHGASVTVQNKEKKTPLDLAKPGLRRNLKTKLGIADDE
ncbi:26S proteasome non-ATPase regulatory subunit 10-like [Toxorhynchites rutilus septentrionalis]|uniref:26S proteasome non-ATPase regulatory subunit 10-like n=1 Tax=Toxorhynchites rutilus septentrionalis TaxID=329112 RepID=UPI00247A3181|nr:26S proteasome non-ATPase regulatory subunit 10-like [Toxorhynchites rutilus septentrionalis]